MGLMGCPEMLAGSYHYSLVITQKSTFLLLVSDLFFIYFCYVCTGLYGVHFLSYLEKQRSFKGLWMLLTM